MVSVIAVSTLGAVLAWIGLAIGLVVAGVVVSLLNGVFKPIREIKRDASAAHSAPLIDRGVVGADQLGRTRQLAEQVSRQALEFLGRSGGAPASAPVSRPGPAPNPFSSPRPSPSPGPSRASRSGHQRPGWIIEDS